MRTLIVPCAGDRKVNDMPLLLLEHPKDGMPLFFRVIEGVFPESYDQIVFVFKKELEDEYGITERIRTTFKCANDKLNVRVVLLDSATSGAAETVYRAILECHITGEISIKDSHAYTKTQNECHGNFITSLDLLKERYYIDDLRTKSFIVSNEQGQILDVIEKRFRSDIITAGLYGIRNAEDFIEAFERLSDKAYGIDQLFVSHIISYLIGYKKQIFYSFEVEDFEEWGSNRIWSHLQRKYANYYLNAEKLFGQQLDLPEKLCELLRERSEKGASFIVVMSNKVENRDIIGELREKGINCISAVYGCSRSSENYYIENALDLEFKGI